MTNPTLTALVFASAFHNSFKATADGSVAMVEKLALAETTPNDPIIHELLHDIGEISEMMNQEIVRRCGVAIEKLTTQLTTPQ